jgi:hypothetical protein
MTASSNPIISQFGGEFDVEKSSQYRMAIQFSLDGLSFALLDAQAQRLIAYEGHPLQPSSDSSTLLRTLDKALDSKGLSGKDFDSVTCIVDERICALVPEPLFDDADKVKYLEFAFQIPNGYTTQAEELPSAQCHNVFAWSKALQDKLLAKWPKAKITHSSSLLIESAMQSETGTGIFINVRRRDFDMVIKKDGKLFFFNNFKFNTKEDFAYFLLFAMEQNGFAGQDTPVRLSGLIQPDSEIMTLCGHYVKDFRIVEDPHKLKVSEALGNVPFQHYFIHYQALR